MSSTTAITRQEQKPPTLKPGEAVLAVFPGETKDGPPLTAIVKSTANGLVKSTLVHVPLSEARGEIWHMGAFVGEQWNPKARCAITAAGYNKLNQFGGMSFATPETLVAEDGKPTSNPYFHREKGEIMYVKCRRIGIGRNAVGNLIAIDLTVTYNIRDYFAQDVFAKWTGKKKDATFANWGEIYDADAVPEEVKKNGKRKLVACPGGVVLAIDLTKKEAIVLISEHIGRQKFGERNAWTICERNILKKFYAAAQLNPNNLTVPVVSWQTVDRDIVQLAKVAADAAAGKVEVGGEELELQRDAEVVGGEDIDAALAGDADEDMQHPEPDGEPEPSGIGVPVGAPPVKDNGQAKRVDELRAKVRDLYGKLDHAVADDILITAQLPAGLAWIGECGEIEQLEAAVNALSIDVAGMVSDTRRLIVKIVGDITTRDALTKALIGDDAASISPGRALAAIKTARALETQIASKKKDRPKTTEEWLAAAKDVAEGWVLA